MPLVTIKQMIYHATQNEYTLGGFQLFSLDDIAATLKAAEICRAPVILEVGWENSTTDNGMLLAAAEHAAHQASVPVGLLSSGLTQAVDAVAAIRHGSNALSIDLTKQPVTDKIAQTGKLVRLAAECGIPVEALLTQVDADVSAVQKFVQHTGVDVLAYELAGSAISETIPDLVTKLTSIERNVDVPLAIHGAGVLDDSDIQSLCKVGVAMMHFAQSIDATKTLQARDEIQQKAMERMLVLGCAERAVDVLTDCTPWEPVEHVIVFNVEAQQGVDIDSVLARGRQVLGEIPGVRYVHTGQAVQSSAAYQFCWLVRFVHSAVIDSYREHPVHKKFADELFRPIAPTRMSIDFYMTTDSGSVQPLYEPESQTVNPITMNRVDRISI